MATVVCNEHRPSTAPAVEQTAENDTSVPPRPPRSLSRPPPHINLDLSSVLQQATPRKRGPGNLALQARDSVAVRKRTLSTGAMSARVARHNARRANTDLLQPTTKGSRRSPSGSPHPRNRSVSPARAPTGSRVSRSPSPSSSSPSQSPTPVTPGQPSLLQGPSSFPVRGRTHIPHDSQGTSTSAYPFSSSSISSRSSSPSPERSRTPSLRMPEKLSLHDAPITSSLDLDPDDVNARLRLLVNNSYFLPPAHAKPDIPSSRPSTGDIKGATSPSAFKEFFRVGKKKERKASDSSGYTSEGVRGVPRTLRVPSNDSPGRQSNDTVRGYGGDGYFDVLSPEERSRNRVVVVRETLDDLPPPLPRAPFRSHAYHGLDTAYNDPTTHYDVPPPTHFASYADLRLDSAGITGNVQLDQFVPPGEPWSPAPSSPVGNGMDSHERVWRRAILEQAVDLSLSSAGSEAGMPEGGSFSRGGRLNSEESTAPGFSALGMVTPSSPTSPKHKRSWWGRKDKDSKDSDDSQRRPSTSSSLGCEFPRRAGTQRSTHSLDVDARSQSSSLRRKRDPLIGQRILPNMHAELEQMEREQAMREKEQNAGLPPPLRLRPLGFPTFMSLSAPATPVYHDQEAGPSTVLRPPPRGEKKRKASGDDLALEFMPGHSTIRKSLSSPLLSDLHETGVDVEGRMPHRNDSNVSLNGIAAPSFVLQDPSGVTSLVNSSTMDSFTSGSHYSDEDHEHDFGGVMAPPDHFTEDDSVSFDHWRQQHSSPANDSGRPSLDSFGAERVRSPEFHPRASSTFGFRRSNASVVTPSPLREPSQSLEVDISGDPIDHLSMMESRSSPTPSGDSHMSSTRGYVSALDFTINRSGAPSMGRPASPTAPSVRSMATRMTSTRSVPEQSESGVESEQHAPIEFFDSIQHGSYLEHDDGSSSDEDVTPGTAVFAAYPEPRPAAQPLARKSLSSPRPSPPAFATQFRNASQPQLPVSRPLVPAIDTNFHQVTPYDMLDRKKPLTNTPLTTPTSTSGGILSQFKGKTSKSPVKPGSPFLGIGKKRSGSSPVVLPESTFEFLRYPNGTTFSVGSGAGTTTTGSDPDSAEARSHVFDGTRSQGSLLSMQSSDTASLKHVGPWREQNAQDESLRKLDGMMMQHLEAERDRLRKIASAAKERGEGARDHH